MKSREILTGIAVRAAAAAPIEPAFTALPYVPGVDGLNDLTWSVRDEYPFLHNGREEISDTDVARFDGLFAWLADQLRRFPDGAVDPDRRLVDMLALATMLESDAELWGELAKAAPNPSQQLIDGLVAVFVDARPDGQKVLERARYNPDQISITLGEIAQRDWRSAEWTMDRLWDTLWLPLKSHAAAALHEYDRARLASLIEGEGDFFDLAAYILHAPVSQVLNLALPSRNWTFKFWAFHKSVRYATAGKPTYPVEWQDLLTQAAHEPDEWPRWMAVLNEYPSRYPLLQNALGSTLVDAPDAALDAYVASVSKAADFGRTELAAALVAFRAKAPLPARQRLWTAAFKRWELWDFGCSEDSRALLRVAKSSFDYPVMGYLTECLSVDDRAKMCAALEARSSAIERDWHVDTTPAMTERFKVISTYQLLAHAEAVAAGDPQWLSDGPLYRPIWEDGSEYRSLKYDPNIGKPTF